MSWRGRGRRRISTPRSTFWTMPPHLTGRYVSGGSKAYRVEGAEDGDGKLAKDRDGARPRWHGQDRSPGGGETRGARRTSAGRLPLRRAPLRLGGGGDVGARCGTWALSTSPTTPTSRSPARWRRCARSQSSPWRTGPGAGAALGAGRARGRARGAGSAGGGGRQSGRRVDNPALDLVHAELQRGLYAGARVERRDPAPGR